MTFEHSDAHTNGGPVGVIKGMPAHATVNPMVEKSKDFDTVFKSLRSQGLSTKDAMAKAREECPFEHKWSPDDEREGGELRSRAAGE